MYAHVGDRPRRPATRRRSGRTATKRNSLQVKLVRPPQRPHAADNGRAGASPTCTVRMRAEQPVYDNYGHCGNTTAHGQRVRSGIHLSRGTLPIACWACVAVCCRCATAWCYILYPTCGRVNTGRFPHCTLDEGGDTEFFPLFPCAAAVRGAPIPRTVSRHQPL
jgi:hypothetical protein